MAARPPFCAVLARDLTEVLDADLPWQRFSGARIAVTGAAGFLGGYLLRSLLALHPAGLVAQPPRLLALVRDVARARQRLADVAAHPQLEFMQWDAARLATPSLGPLDFVLHAAAQASPRSYARDPVGTALPNSVGTAALLRAAEGGQGLLYVSSSEVYGQAQADRPLHEDDTGRLDPAALRSCYAESKRLGETLCVAWHAQHRLPTWIVRPFHTYGPGLQADDGRVFADFAHAAARGQPMVMTSEGSARRAFCYASDAARGIFTVMLKGQPATPYNLANPQAELSVLELAQLLVSLSPQGRARLQRRPPPAGYLPSPFNRLVPDVGRLQALGWRPRVGAREGFGRFVAAIGAEWGAADAMAAPPAAPSPLNLSPATP